MIMTRFIGQHFFGLGLGSLLAVLPAAPTSAAPTPDAAPGTPATAVAAPLAPPALDSLLKTYAPSIVEVRYFFKADSDGQIPDDHVKISCPNCQDDHYESLDSLIDERQSADSPGFALAEDQIAAVN